MSEPKPITTEAELRAFEPIAPLAGGIGAMLLDSLRESLRREAALKHAAQALVNAMETCHICTSSVIVDDSPIHCEDCSYDCEEHGPPSCVTLDIIHARLKRLIKSGTGSATQQAGENSEKERK